MMEPNKSASSSHHVVNRRTLLIYYLWLVLGIVVASPVSLASVEDVTVDGPSLVANWVRARCGGEDGHTLGSSSNTPPAAALWIYEGALYDPLEGKRIARVQGLELVCPWADCPNDESAAKSKYQERCGDLISSGLLSNPNATFDYASTILSRKLFCYTKEEGYENKDGNGGRQQSLLTSIRLRHKSPLKVIPTDQAVALYETATTIIQRGKELIVHSEWPNGMNLWGTTSIRNQLRDMYDTPSIRNRGSDDGAKSSSSASLEYTVYTRRRSKKVAQVPDLTTEPVSFDADSTAVVVSPKRSALIQFGASSMEQKDRFGARETYSYSNIPISDDSNNNKGIRRFWQRNRSKDISSPCRVQYTRYGEGPPFYAPGRMCTLELRGWRATSQDDIPSLITSLIQERIPDFFNSNPLMIQSYEHSNDNDPSCMFRQSTLKLLPDPNAPPLSWQEQRRDQVGAILQDAARVSTSLLSRIFSIRAIAK